MQDFKVFAVSDSKLNPLLWSTTSTAVQDTGLHWNPKKCSVLHIRRGKQAEDATSLKPNKFTVVQALRTGSTYKRLGVRESVIQDEKLLLKKVVTKN